jgi:hypothetical protein
MKGLRCAAAIAALALATPLASAVGSGARPDAPASRSAAAPVPEYAMKATYLYNFMVYTQWPRSGATPAPSMTMCILGPDPFGAATANLQRKTINGTPITVSVINSLEGVRKCQLLYVTERESGNMDAVLRQISDAPVLTVAESPVASNAAIQLALEGQRLVFDVNQAQLRRASLTLSSKVLQLAREVHN